MLEGLLKEIAIVAGRLGLYGARFEGIQTAAKRLHMLDAQIVIVAIRITARNLHSFPTNHE